MGAYVIFFVFLTATLVVVAKVMGPVADGWRDRELAARAKSEAIRRRLRARGIEPDARASGSGSSRRS